jgi:HK97 family phage major capsid protein
MNEIAEKVNERVGKTIEEAVLKQIKPYTDSLFEEVNKVKPNKLLTGMQGYQSEEKFHNFDTYEERDSKGFDSFRDFLKCVHEKDYRALENCRVESKDILAGEAPGSMLIPSKFVAEIITAMKEKEIVRNLARIYKIKRGVGESATIPAVQSYDFSENVAGLQAYWKGEGASYQESTPTLRQLKLSLHKLTILSSMSEELIFGSAVNTDSLLTGLFADACSFELDNVFITGAGTGAGKPLSIANGSDLITITAETGQDPDTLIAENLGNMMKRLTPGAFNSAVWLCSVDNILELLKCGFKLGTASIPLKIFSESNGKFYILGRPVIFTQFCDGLGEADSIMLTNWRRYAILTRDTMLIRSDEGKSGTNFTKDLVSFKLTYYVDGQPMDSSTTLLKDGTTTVANFITVPSI